MIVTCLQPANWPSLSSWLAEAGWGLPMPLRRFPYLSPLFHFCKSTPLANHVQYYVGLPSKAVNLARRLRRRRMIMHMRLFSVLLLLLIPWVIVAVGERTVVMLMGVPCGTVFPLRHYAVSMMVRHVVVIMRVRCGWMSMLRLLAFAFRALCRHIKPPLLHLCGKKHSVSDVRHKPYHKRRSSSRTRRRAIVYGSPTRRCRRGWAIRGRLHAAYTVIVLVPKPGSGSVGQCAVGTTPSSSPHCIRCA